MIPVIELRQAMIKNPHHRLWDKPLSKWTEQEKQEFHNLDKKKKPNWKAVNSVKVVRVSDGVQYDSISDCRRKNNLCKVMIYRKLDEGIEFKRV